MKVTFIQHSCFLVETERFYYLFDYEKGHLPELDVNKPIYVLASHGHYDHYNSDIFSVLKQSGMKCIHGILSDDIKILDDADILQVSSGNEYDLNEQLKVTTFHSTDLGVAFLIEDEHQLIYHAGDLNDWVWDEESDDYNQQMTHDYQKQILLLKEKLDGRILDAAFVVLDPRQEKDYDRGLCTFLNHVSAHHVYPMHTWNTPSIIDAFIKDHPQYTSQIIKCEEKEVHHEI